MEQKLPYYMVYPMPFVDGDERQARRDLEYMKSLGDSECTCALCGRGM